MTKTDFTLKEFQDEINNEAMLTSIEDFLKSSENIDDPDKLNEMLEKNRVENKDVWPIIEEFFKHNGLTSHQLKSFSNFIYEGAFKALAPLSKIVVKSEKNPHLEYTIEFVNFFFHPPRHVEVEGDTHRIFPIECMWRNISYVSLLTCTVIVTPKGHKPNVHENTILGNIPVMVRSDICNTSDMIDDPEELAKHHECIYDKGGYFIISPNSKSNPGGGAIRRMIAQTEEIASNQVYVYPQNKTNKNGMNAEIKSISNSSSHMTNLSLKIDKANNILCSFSWIDILNIPMGTLFKALGVEDEEVVVQLILGPNWENSKYLDIIVDALSTSSEVETQEAAQMIIGRLGKKFKTHDPKKKKVEKKEILNYVNYVLSHELFPHLNGMYITSKGQSYFKNAFENENQSDDDDEFNSKEFKEFNQSDFFKNTIYIKKAVYLGYAIKRLLTVFCKDVPQDSRDDISNKVFVDVGTSLSQQLYTAFRRLVTDITKSAKASLDAGKPADITRFINPRVITNSMIGAISNNNWGKGKKDGLAQIHSQFNFIDGLASLRKTIQNMGEKSNVIAARELNDKHDAVKCLAETPEGKTVGFVSNLSLACFLSLYIDPVPIYDILFKCKKELNFSSINMIIRKKKWEMLKHTMVFINGDIVGVTKNYHKFIFEMREKRRLSMFDRTISIVYKEKLDIIRINTTAGRACRVVFIVKNGDLMYKKHHIKKLKVGTVTWDGLFQDGILEVIDKEEEGNYTIAYTPKDVRDEPNKYTHCTMHPCLMYGVSGSIIPFSNHNQSPRNTYQCAMGKQAIGTPFLNYRRIMSGDFHTMMYTQKPLAISNCASIVKFDMMPCGQDAYITIMCAEYNEEDSIEMSRTSIDRGFMVSYKWVVYYAEFRKEKHEKLMIPPETKNNASLLDEDGIVSEGVTVKDGDILIGRVICSNGNFIDNSIKYSHAWPAKVDKVQIGVTGEGYTYVRVMTVQRREPIVADKFSFCPGQKGTVGIIKSQEDMPFDRRGIPVDAILNSLAIPSRMTIALLIEMISGKVVTADSWLHNTCINDTEISDTDFSERFSSRDQFGLADATSFEKKVTIYDIIKEAKRLGIQGFGEELLTDGRTGTQLKGLVFCGPVYFQRLKHMVIDKIHARARGGITALTRQAPEGRAANGGLKTGGMERDCLAGQGVSYVLKDRLFEQSDKFTMTVCKICGVQVDSNKDDKFSQCPLCNTNNTSVIPIPYAAKLLTQELMVTGVVQRLIPK